MSSVIHILGAGINSPDHLSLETVKVLKTCPEVWTNMPEGIYSRLAESLPVSIKSLKPFFLNNRPRRENYDAITAHIMERAAELSEIGYLTQGNPLIFDSVAANLVGTGKAAGIDVRVYPAVSSIDTVLIDVMYDPARGIQIHEATAFVRKRIVIDPRAALMLLQPSVFGSGMPRLSAGDPAPDLKPLQDALLSYYPADHPVLFVRSRSSTMSSYMYECRVGGVSIAPPESTLATSLFLRPLPTKWNRLISQE